MRINLRWQESRGSPGFVGETEVNKKVSKLGRYIDENVEAQVTMSVEGYRHIIEVIILFNGVVIRGRGIH